MSASKSVCDAKITHINEFILALGREEWTTGHTQEVINSKNGYYARVMREALEAAIEDGYFELVGGLTITIPNGYNHGAYVKAFREKCFKESPAYFSSPLATSEAVLNKLVPGAQFRVLILKVSAPKHAHLETVFRSVLKRKEAVLLGAPGLMLLLAQHQEKLSGLHAIISPYEDVRATFGGAGCYHHEFPSVTRNPNGDYEYSVSPYYGDEGSEGCHLLYFHQDFNFQES